MLTISRKVGQQVRFIWGGKDVQIDVVSVGGHRVRLEVNAPADLSIETLDAKPRPDGKPRHGSTPAGKLPPRSSQDGSNPPSSL
jgi:hypothetical protein